MTMSRIRTHYDNLKIARNAPAEVIRAAYKVLTQKYHPDKNPGDARASRIMHIINSSYEVLSDPERRAAHDLWIANGEQEAEAKRKRRWFRESHATAASGEPINWEARLADEQFERRRLERLLALERQRTAEFYSIQAAANAGTTRASMGRTKLALTLFLPILVVAVLLILAYKAGKVDAGFRKLSRTIPRLSASLAGARPVAPMVNGKTAGESPTPASTGSQKSAYVRPKTGPNGLPWPRHAGYLAGSKVLRDQGLSSATIDNTRNDADVLAKLMLVVADTDAAMTLRKSQGLPSWQSPKDIRVFFVPAYASFTLKSINPGTYEVHYRDLDQGVEWKSDAFALKEMPGTGNSFDGLTARYSSINMMLYRGPANFYKARRFHNNTSSGESNGIAMDTARRDQAPLWNLSNTTVHDELETR